MKTLPLEQGSDQWKAARLKYFCASETAAMLGLSKRVQRNEMLRMKATSTEKEYSEWVEKNLFDKGHEIEFSTLPMACEIMGEELFPIVGIIDYEGLHFLASFDGITMAEDRHWECKMLNKELIDHIQEHQDIPDEYWPQVETQFLVSGSSRCLFTPSDGTKENLCEFWYEPKPERRKQLIAGIKQFQEDLQNYVPEEVIPAPIATPQMSLPALSVQVMGGVSVRDNLKVFGEALTDYVERINKKPETDQDFADLEATVKALKNAEEGLEAARKNALGQVSSVDEMCRTVDHYRELARSNRLLVEKIVKSEKENRRNAMVSRGNVAFREHFDSLNKRIGRQYMPPFPAEFSACIKGLKTMSSIQNAIDTELARVKILANEIADKIETNVKEIRRYPDYGFLFSDEHVIVLKEPQDLSSLIKIRIAEFEEKEERRIAAERVKMEAEQQAAIEKAEAQKRAEIAAAVKKAEEEAVEKERKRVEAEQVQARIEKQSIYTPYRIEIQKPIIELKQNEVVYSPPEEKMMEPIDFKESYDPHELSITQKRVSTVLCRMMAMVQQSEDDAKMFSEAIDCLLNDMNMNDSFGTEGQNDPRGDMREGEWSMYRVQGVDE